MYYKFNFKLETQERLAKVSWWVFRRYYQPNLSLTREDWEDIRQEIYFFAYNTPIQGVPTSRKQRYRLIHAMLYNALRRMGYVKPKRSSLYIKNYYIERMCNRLNSNKEVC